MGEGPTTVGSINAKLTLDADQFEQKMTTAGEKADRLDGRKIDVKVDADTAKAEAQLEALQIAENKLRIAQLNLDKVEKDVNATEQQRLRAQNALIQAGSQFDKLVEKQIGTNEELKVSEDRVNESHKTQFDLISALIGISPALLAGSVTIASATVGLGTAFAGMGAAGLVAIKGIKDNMEAGTQTGQAYSAGIASLKGNFEELSNTAAVSLLDAFDRAVVGINQHLPFLNQLTGEMGAALGSIGGGVLQATVTGLERMMPLIETGAVELQKFVGFLMGFANADGFQTFITYAQANLPSVTELLENVVTLAGHLLAAFAPVGPVVIAALNGLTGALNALPLPVLAILATGATTAVVAFRMLGSEAIIGGLKSLASAIGLSAAATQFAVPVVGLLVGGLTLLTTNALQAADAQQRIVQASQDFADAVKKDNDAIGENVRIQTLQKLISDGTAQAIQRQGLSLYTTMQAITGNTEAQQRLNGELDTLQQKLGLATHNGQVQGQANQQLKADIDKVRQATGTYSGAIQDQIQKQQLLNQVDSEAAQQKLQQKSVYADFAGQLGTTVGSLQSAYDAQQKNAQAAEDAMAKMQLENDAAGILKATLDGLNGKALSAAQAQNNFDSQLANMGTHVDKVGKQITFTTDNIGDMSAASVALRGQLNGQVAALQQVVEANGGLDNSTGQARQQMETMRQQIIDNAVAHGVDRDAVTQYIDKILQIPASVPPTKTDVDTANALTKLQILQDALNNLHGHQITVPVYYAEVNSVNANDFGGNAAGVGNNTAPAAHARGGWAGSPGTVVHMAGGGRHPFAFGSDTVATMLDPREFVVSGGSANRLESDHPGALDYMNRTGKLPTQQQAPVVVQAFPDQVTLVVDGYAFTAYVDKRADARIGAAAGEARYTRVGL
jgi:hypothetical protein